MPNVKNIANAIACGARQKVKSWKCGSCSVELLMKAVFS